MNSNYNYISSTNPLSNNIKKRLSTSIYNTYWCLRGVDNGAACYVSSRDSIFMHSSEKKSDRYKKRKDTK